MFIKVCGLRTPDDVRVAVEAGADAVGFVLEPTSPRFVTLEQARELVALVPATVASVLVVASHSVDEAVAAMRATGADVLQLHGKYTADDVRTATAAGATTWRATSLAHEPAPSPGAWGEDVLLVDSAVPGSGSAWAWDELPASLSGRWLLAGGLTPGSIAQAIAQARPWGVDVSSGVEEERGTKSHDLIRRFVAAARSPQRELAVGPDSTRRTTIIEPSSHTSH